MLIDLICLILLVLAVFKGMSRGFIVAVFSFVAFIIGMAAALKLSATVAEHLHHKMNVSGYWLPILSFTIVFTVVVFAIRIGAKMVKKVAGIFFLGWLDSLLGILLYSVMYLMIFSVVLFFATRIYLISEDVRQASKTYEYVAPFGPKVIGSIGKVVPVFNHMFADLSSYFETVAKKHSS